MQTLSHSPLKTLFEVAEVDKVFHLDDDYDLSRKKLRGLAHSCVMSDESLVRRVLVGYNERLKRKAVSIEQVDIAIDSVPSADFDSVFSELGGDLGGISPGEGANVALRELVECAGVEFHAVSCRDWVENKAEVIGRISRNSLFIFDDDFSSVEGPLSRKKGRDFMAVLLQQSENVEDRPHCFLLTNNAPEEGDEIGFKEEIQEHLQGLDDSASHKYRHGWSVLSKAVLSRNVGEREAYFTQRLRLVILAKGLKVLRDSLSDQIQCALAHAGSALDEMDDAVLDGAIIRSSTVEGAWPADTVRRLITLESERRLITSVYRSRAVHKAVNLALAITGEPPNELIRDGLRELERKERYLSACDINPCHLPLASGDIFRVGFEGGGKAGYYVLLGQPCDLAVRSSGRRYEKIDRDESLTCKLFELSAMETGSVFGVSMEPFLESDCDCKPKRRKLNATIRNKVLSGSVVDDQSLNGRQVNVKVKEWTGKVQEVDPHESKRFSVHLNLFLAVPAWVLDLCVFSSEGKCEYFEDMAKPEHMVPAWGARWPIVLGKATEQMKVINTVRQSNKSDIKTLSVYKSIIGLNSKINLTTKVGEGGSSFSGFGLEIERCGRLLEPWSTRLLVAYSNYAARTAFPHDWTRGVS